MRTAPNKRVLTELFIPRLKPRATPYLIWDAEQGSKGLAIRVEPSGYASRASP